jgi:hypothetical protein
MTFRFRETVWIIAVFVQTIALGGPSFSLSGTDYLAVTSAYEDGLLHNSSSADVQTGGSVIQTSAYHDSSVTLSGGSMNVLSAYDNSNVHLAGGSITQLTLSDSSHLTALDGSIGEIYADGTSSIQMSGGALESLSAYGSSTASIFGGAVTDYLGAWDDSELELNGGMIDYLDAGGYSSTTFYGYGWTLAGTLSITGNQLFGTGTLSGFWGDGTSWSTLIGYNPDTSTITLVDSPPVVVPVPSALMLAVLGSSAVLRLRRRYAM